jgi:hypothetical protein
MTADWLEGYRCPRCNCNLLIDVIDVVCSYIYCIYGIGDSDVKLVDGKLVEVVRGSSLQG